MKVKFALGAFWHDNISLMKLMRLESNTRPLPLKALEISVQLCSHSEFVIFQKCNISLTLLNINES